MSRRDFWRRYFFLIVPVFIVGIFAGLTASAIFEWLLWSFYSFFSFLIIFLVIKRLHDVGKRGWWALFLFVPGMNIYLVYLLFFKKGI